MSDARIAKLPKWAREHIAKLEKARKDAEHAGRCKEALRWTEPVEPDVDIPDKMPDLATGFLYNAHFTSFTMPYINEACSSSMYHAVGRSDKTTTQTPRRLYSTKLLALKALRNAVEDTCAKVLAHVDEQIEHERELDGLPKTVSRS